MDTHQTRIRRGRGKNTHDTVGCTKVRCSARSLGMEYESVLIVCFPVAEWVNTENSVLNRLLAVLTGI